MRVVVPESAARRIRSTERVPYPQLDLREAGLKSFAATLPVVLHRRAVAALRSLQTETTTGPIWTWKTYRRGGSDYNIFVGAVLPSRDRAETFVNLEFLPGEAPRRPPAPFNQVWTQLHFVAESSKIRAAVRAGIDATPDVVGRLPVQLPLVLPSAASVGEVYGVRFVRPEDDKWLYNLSIDLRPDKSMDVTLAFTRDVPTVATAADDLLGAAKELLAIILVGRAPGGS
jgi:hypothetical protein